MGPAARKIVSNSANVAMDFLSQCKLKKVGKLKRAVSTFSQLQALRKDLLASTIAAQPHQKTASGNGQSFILVFAMSEAV